MFKIDPSRAIGAYAAVMTAVAAYVVLGGAAAASATFDTIDVKRINVREDDGTLRMIVAGRDHLGGIVVGDREYPHPNRTEAGMIFFNDERGEWRPGLQRQACRRQARQRRKPDLRSLASGSDHPDDVRGGWRVAPRRLHRQ